MYKTHIHWIVFHKILYTEQNCIWTQCQIFLRQHFKLLVRNDVKKNIKSNQSLWRPIEKDLAAAKFFKSIACNRSAYSVKFTRQTTIKIYIILSRAISAKVTLSFFIDLILRRWKILLIVLIRTKRAIVTTSVGRFFVTSLVHWWSEKTWETTYPKVVRREEKNVFFISI